ncbi:unnamed protein product [Prorocentrum cordatum]|uniref:Uncharacterized protein n=1 Tax=Prorocentrum cordatum TaxID=2364126 RepID=A0ABN9WNW1_9DINO|nr:unnamed protein product [Polarella glacialis]
MQVAHGTGCRAGDPRRSRAQRTAAVRRARESADAAIRHLQAQLATAKLVIARLEMESRAFRVEVTDELQARLMLIAPALQAQIHDVEVPIVVRMRRNAAAHVFDVPAVAIAETSQRELNAMQRSRSWACGSGAEARAPGVWQPLGPSAVVEAAAAPTVEVPFVESAMREVSPVFVPVANAWEPLPPPPAGPAAIIGPLWGMTALPAAAAPAAAAHRDADGEGPGAAARAWVPAGLPRDPGEGLLFANGSAAATDPSTSTPSAKGLSLSRVVACDSEDDGLLNEYDLSDFDV